MSELAKKLMDGKRVITGGFTIPVSGTTKSVSIPALAGCDYFCVYPNSSGIFNPDFNGAVSIVKNASWIFAIGVNGNDQITVHTNVTFSSDGLLTITDTNYIVRFSQGRSYAYFGYK